jgi:hypothetical protein
VNYQDAINDKRKAAQEAAEKKQNLDKTVDATTSSGKEIISEIARQGARSRSSTQKVQLENENLAKTDDIQGAIDSINKLNLTTFVASQDKYTQMVNQMTELCGQLENLAEHINTNGKTLDSALITAVDKVNDVSVKLTKSLEEANSNTDVKDLLKESVAAIKAIDVSPVVNVETPKITIPKAAKAPEIDLKPFTEAIRGLEAAIIDNKVELPDFDFSSLSEQMMGVKTAINSLSFPVPNYILPFKDPTTGKATQATLTASGALPVEATIDTSAISTSANQTNGSQKTQLVDAGGEAATVTGGKLDVNASVDTTGLATSAKQDTGNTSLASIDGKITAVNTGAVVVSSSALPTGAATEATLAGAIKAEDAAHTTGDKGIMGLSVRSDTAAATAGTDGDYQPLITDATGKLHVNVGNAVTVSSHAVTNAGTFAVQDSDKIADNGGFTDGTSKVMPAGFIYDDVAGTVLTENDVAAARVDSKRAQAFVLEDGTTRARYAQINSVGQLSTLTNVSQINGVTPLMGNGASGTGAQRVSIASDSTGNIATIGTSVTPGTAAANLGKAEDAGHTTGDVGVFALAVRNDNAATSVTNANADYSQVSTDITGTVFTRQSPSNTPALTNVSASATTQTALAANAARRTAVFYNDSTSDCYIKYGAAASATSFTYYLPSLGTLSIDGNEYAGLVAVIHASATGTLRVTETSI